MITERVPGARRVALPLVGLLLVAAIGGGIAAAPPNIHAGDAAETQAEDEQAGPQPAEQTQLGWILLPTTDSTRVFTPQSLRGVTFEKVQVTAAAAFLLREQRTTGASTCAAGTCTETGDFDVVFFRERADGTATVVVRHSNVGDEEGRVPVNANFALVFLRTPAMQQDAQGSGFVYLESAPGGTVLPPWP